MRRGHLQRSGCDVVRQLQRGLRVSCSVDVIVSCGRAVSSWQVQRFWRGVVQQLQRRIRLPVRWRHKRHRATMCRGYIQLSWRSVVR
jgi:hypothetical protein